MQTAKEPCPPAWQTRSKAGLEVQVVASSLQELRQEPARANARISAGSLPPALAMPAQSSAPWTVAPTASEHF